MKAPAAQVAGRGSLGDPLFAHVSSEVGPERKCNGCGEWWPLDGEFFYRHVYGFRGFQAICKACRSERRKPEARRGTPRRRVDTALLEEMLAAGRHPNDIADALGCTPRTVYRRRRAA